MQIFKALLKADVPGVFVLGPMLDHGGIYHTFALCAHHANSCLSTWLEAFLKDVYYYFSRSNKRQHQFHLIQDVVEAPYLNACHKAKLLQES